MSDDLEADLDAVTAAMAATDVMSPVSEGQLADDVGLDRERVAQVLSLAESRGVAIRHERSTGDASWYLAHAGEWARLVRGSQVVNTHPIPGPRPWPGERLNSADHGSFDYVRMEVDPELGAVHVYEWVADEPRLFRFGFRDNHDGARIQPFVE